MADEDNSRGDDIRLVKYIDTKLDRDVSFNVEYNEPLMNDSRRAGSFGPSNSAPNMSAYSTKNIQFDADLSPRAGDRKQVPLGSAAQTARKGEISFDFLKEKGLKEHWWIAPHEIVLPEREMASGSCGKVYKTKWRALRVAVKTIKKASRKALEDLQREIFTWSTTRHPNIVSFLGASYSGDLGVVLIMEFMSGGDLQNLIDDTEGPVSYKRGLRCALDIGRALCFLHSCKPRILHRDLKPPNVLFDNHGVAKIADFGLSKFVGDSLKPYRMTAKTGTVRYMAPEVLLGKKYDISVDVYSFGW
eukprot:CAMPEP_0167761314 /NCGR_PEP_ID=MMETSP0110_2-20121227/12098_1 /TAXON_ID=629695 /ORGANISM="Gymnochlora sp., Strain CCMP2014" /LENGTH=302 /DNA_ID=CAMNT_0007647973 /DNA_START=35 /DNA_END=940 /DNA_ORIENTATION=+